MKVIEQIEDKVRVRKVVHDKPVIRHNSVETNRIILVDKTTNIKESYSYPYEVAAKLNVTINAVYQCCRKNLKLNIPTHTVCGYLCYYG